jgi:hypothetical protein
MERSSSIIWLTTLIGSSLAFGCGGRASDNAQELLTCQVAIGERLIAHTCSHTENGPFMEVAASTGSTEFADVSRLHTPFDVTVLNFPFSLSYRASRAGTHVVFTNEPVAWEISDQSGAALTVRANVDTSPEGSRSACPGTANAVLVEFSRGKNYVFASGNAPSRFTLFIEHLETFGSGALLNSCPGDEP